jgi:hypothetical protein
MKDINNLSAILWKKWEKHPDTATMIIGFWAEDGNSYYISTPAQLRNIIVNMQNWLAEIYIKLENLKSQIKSSGLQHSWSEADITRGLPS